MYWRLDIKISFISELMGRDKWIRIKRCINFNDNSIILKALPRDFDCLYKVKILLDSIKLKFNDIKLDCFSSG